MAQQEQRSSTTDRQSPADDGSAGSPRDNEPRSGGDASQTRAERYVFVDTSEPAYTVFVAVPAARVAELQSKTAGSTSLHLVPWPQFRAATDEWVLSRIQKNEYEQYRVAEGLLALLSGNEGAPFGLTWNGGIAFTHNDYAHAQRTHKAFTEDPDEYERTRDPDPRGDPVNPGSHFGPLLGDRYLKQ